ncbi:MAG: hypothetical protein IIT53_14880 [Fibrobacter sp.]|nr:hypothetical protein [Fibrobacter sp.]
MFDFKNYLYIAGLLALCAFSACSSDDSSIAGSTTIPNATAENSSSSEKVASSSSEINTSSSSTNSTVMKQDIVFATAATSVKKIARGEVTVYGKENGAEATCSAGKSARTKEYLARISFADGKTMERTILLRNFGDACDDIYKAFQESCRSGLVDVALDAVCSGNGNLKAFCYASKTDSVRACSSIGGCISAGPDSTISFDTLLESFTEESNDICGNIADGVDTTDFDIPISEPDSSIKVNSGRIFILEPSTDKLDVTDEERAILDSLAAAFPQQTRTDELDGMTIFINYDAEYNFTTEGKKFIQNGSFCEGNIYESETGVKRQNTFSIPYGHLFATTILSEDAIVYLVRGASLSAESSKEVWDSFLEECNATNGSFYDYRPHESLPVIACAVKNFTGTPFSTIVSEQATFCKKTYTKFEKPILDSAVNDTIMILD